MSKIVITKGTLLLVILVAALISGVTAASISTLVINSQSLQLATGATGANGTAGLTGPRGEIGATGPTGPAGLAGVVGSTGVKGDSGAMGTNGAIWYTGTGAPASSLGVNNDFYFDSISSDVYNKVSDVWIKVTNIRGATGPTGSIGATGPMGLKGDTGQQGLPGATVTNYTNIGYVGTLNYAGNNIGNVAITAPANGSIHITLTGYVQMFKNNSCLVGIGSNPGLTDLDATYVGTSTPGSTSEQTMYSLMSQAVVPVTEGKTYVFYASGFKWDFDDSAAMTLNSVKITAEFSER